MTRYALCALFITLALSGLARAQIDVNEVNQQHKLIEANCQCVVPDGASPVYFWSASSGVDYRAVDDGRRLIMTAPPGQHSVSIQAIFVNWDTRQITQQSYTRSFEVEGKESPDPQPDPDPDPNPDGKASKLVVIRESENFPYSLNQMLQRISREGVGTVATRSLWIFDPDDTSSTTAQQWISKAGSPLPWLLVLRDDNAVLKSVRLPESYNGVEELTK